MTHLVASLRSDVHSIVHLFFLVLTLLLIVMSCMPFRHRNVTHPGSDTCVRQSLSHGKKYRHAMTLTLNVGPDAEFPLVRSQYANDLSSELLVIKFAKTEFQSFVMLRRVPRASG